MNKFITLLKCEEKRMVKYGITYASLAVSVIWIILIQIINIKDISKYFPLFLFVDATMMSFLLVGASMMFEKQENVLKTLLVIPASKHTYLLSKLTSTILSSLSTLVLLGAYGVILKNLKINYFGIVCTIILISFVFGNIGMLFTYKSKDFTNLLMWVFIFSFVLTIPTLLQAFNIITAEWFKYVQYINPTKSALIVLDSTVKKVDQTDLIISISYLSVLAGTLYYFVSKGFDKFSVKEYGGE